MIYGLNQSDATVKGSHFRIPPLIFFILSTYSQLCPSRLIRQYFSKEILPQEVYWSQLCPCNRAIQTKLRLITVTSLQSSLNTFCVPS